MAQHRQREPAHWPRLRLRCVRGGVAWRSGRWLQTGRQRRCDDGPAAHTSTRVTARRRTSLLSTAAAYHIGAVCVHADCADVNVARTAHGDMVRDLFCAHIWRCAASSPALHDATAWPCRLPEVDAAACSLQPPCRPLPGRALLLLLLLLLRNHAEALSSQLSASRMDAGMDLRRCIGHRQGRQCKQQCPRSQRSAAPTDTALQTAAAPKLASKSG